MGTKLTNGNNLQINDSWCLMVTADPIQYATQVIGRESHFGTYPGMLHVGHPWRSSLLYSTCARFTAYGAGTSHKLQ